MIKRKYVVLSLFTLVSVMLGGLLYSNLAQAQSTVTGYVSVPAAAFVPWDNADHVRYNSHIYLENLEISTVFSLGPVQLPHGATVTNVTVYWYDAGAENVYCLLERHNQTSIDYMARTNSSGTAGLGSVYDDTIDYATVNNSRYAYILAASIPPDSGDYRLYYVIIEYTLPSEGAVGGLYIPVDNFSLLAPYITLVSTIILAVSASVAYIKYRKKQ